jgi:hypothetical protein
MNTMANFRRIIAIAAIIAGAGPVRATSFYWDIGGSTNGAGGATPSGNGDGPPALTGGTLNLAEAGTVTVSGARMPVIGTTLAGASTNLIVDTDSGVGREDFTRTLPPAYGGHAALSIENGKLGLRLFSGGLLRIRQTERS